MRDVIKDKDYLIGKEIIVSGQKYIVKEIKINDNSGIYSIYVKNKTIPVSELNIGEYDSLINEGEAYAVDSNEINVIDFEKPDKINESKLLKEDNKMAKDKLIGKEISLSELSTGDIDNFELKNIKNTDDDVYEIYVKNKISPLVKINESVFDELVKNGDSGVFNIGKNQYVIKIIDFEKEPEESNDLELVKDEKLNKTDYKYYIVGSENKIIDGFEYKEEARDRLKGIPKSIGGKVVAKKDLSINPDDDSNWGGSDNKFEAILNRAKNYYTKYSTNEIKKFIDEYQIPGNINSTEDFQGNHLTNNEILEIYENCLLEMIEKAQKYKLQITKDVLFEEYKLANDARYNLK